MSAAQTAPAALRPSRPKPVTLPLPAAATRWGVDKDLLEEWAWQGRLPPTLAQWSPSERCWLFSRSKASGRSAARHAAKGGLWLAGVDEQVCEVTAAWADGIDGDGGRCLRLDLVWWCLSAPRSALEAEPGDFATWCSDHPHGGAVTARHHANVSAWYEMLTAAGMPHNDPAYGTRVTVLWEHPDDWQPDRIDPRR